MIGRGISDGPDLSRISLLLPIRFRYESSVVQAHLIRGGQQP